MKNKYVKLAYYLIFVIGSISIVFYYSKMPHSGIVVLILAGLTLGIISSFLGFINPPKWLYKLRLVIFQIGFGIFIGLILFIAESFKNQTFIIRDLALYLILGLIFATIFGSIKYFLRFRKLFKKILTSDDNKAILCDSAMFKGSEGQIFIGKLVLTKNRLIFYSAKNSDFIYELKLTEVIPTIERSKSLKIPKGLNLMPDKTKVYVRFPYYWLKAIENEQQTSHNKHYS